MFTVDEIVTEKLEIKKSTFISYLVPYDQFDSYHAYLKKEHKKANHIVWAYRFLNDYNQIIENQTDDGEPKNTSGKPTLNVLKGKNLVNVAIFTVRYFGGIKLGTGGLVKAYTESAAKVVSKARLIDIDKCYTKDFLLDYNKLNFFEYLIRINNVKIIDKKFTTNQVNIKLQGDKKVLEEIALSIENKFH
ncbi:YigZ family protein [Deferribacter autotrophicus]|uniref:YigZ family protein n=1 Tax=Deferribacter autotrophicus TaxID=500465 RepID=A0A5A8EYR6_9BACT|nr:YigZ family protein [Deferribacter autotrophicus]KAA0256811.1 YigZ family protein [Deferribacter autotrophicus]